MKGAVGPTFTPTSPGPIVEETLTSDKYILVFLISILNIYIYIYMKFEYLHPNQCNFQRKMH